MLQVAALAFNSSGTLLASGSLDSESFSIVANMRVTNTGLPELPSPTGSFHPRPLDSKYLSVAICCTVSHVIGTRVYLGKQEVIPVLDLYICQSLYQGWHPYACHSSFCSCGRPSGTDRSRTVAINVHCVMLHHFVTVVSLVEALLLTPCGAAR